MRREQIVRAAVDVIVERGLHNLSLSRIEERTGMKRGQLTYYFKHWEDILLAVFDRLLLLMMQRFHEAEGACRSPGDATRGVPCVWECVQKMLQAVLGPVPLGPQFHALQYTFLAQITHRDDFRVRLASLYEEWRSGLAAHWQVTVKAGATPANDITPRTVASFVQAVVHGLQVQLAADPDAFDRTEMLKLCVGLLAPLFAPGHGGGAGIAGPPAAPLRTAASREGGFP